MEVLLFLGGLITGALLTILIRKKPKPSGIFVMDFTDPVKDVCRLELGEDLNSIYQKKQIVLDIKTYGEDSQN